MAITAAEVKARIDQHIQDQEYPKAERLLFRLLSRYPEDIGVLSTLANIYHNTQRHIAARSCFERALHAEPDNFGLLSNYSNLLHDTEEVEKSIELSEKAYALAPDHYSVRKNLANKYRDNKQFEQALELYRTCLEEQPDDVRMNFDIGFISLYLRDLETGWEHFKHRMQLTEYNFSSNWAIPEWDGTTSLKDKRLVVIAEQGHGDTILLSRFLPWVIEQSATTGFACAPSIQPLLGGLEITFEDNSNLNQDEYDFYIPMMSIPPLVEKDWLKWPKPIDLTIPQLSKDKFKWLDKHSGNKLKIGIVWSGNPEFKSNFKRAVNLDRFLDLNAKYPQIQFYSFQKGEPEAQLNTYGWGTLFRFGHMLDHFGDTAAALEHMDLVIMTDSAVVHLAGSLDVPLIDLLQFVPYWLYFPEQSTTALYDSVRFIRQPKQREWDTVFQKTDDILAALTQEHEKSPLSRDEILSIIDKNL